jgi:hypothetical protein
MKKWHFPTSFFFCFPQEYQAANLQKSDGCKKNVGVGNTTYGISLVLDKKELQEK